MSGYFEKQLTAYTYSPRDDTLGRTQQIQILAWLRMYE